MDKILIITGGNKGIGKGIVEAYQANGYQIISIARTKNNTPAYQYVKQIEFNLSQTTEIEQLLNHVFQSLTSENITSITLINNAGTLGEIGRIENIKDITQTVQLNSIAPLILISSLIRLTKDWKCTKHIINISSGAAQKPYSGWAVYCATKAALDMMTKVIALEQAELENGVKIIAIYPGVVDTDMQAEIRKSNKESFANIDRFLALKATNSLANVTTVGKQILAIDQDTSIVNGSLIRVDE